MANPSTRGNSSSYPVSDAAAPDAVEETTLGNISTEVQINYAPEVKVIPD